MLPLQADTHAVVRILQVNTSDHAGGAERVAWNLFQAYRDRGHQSWLAVGLKRSLDPDVIELRSRAPAFSFRAACSGFRRSLAPLQGRIRGVKRICGWLRLLERGWRTPFDRALGREDFNFPASRNLLRITAEKPDLVHAHNLHGGYFDLRILARLSRRLPVILTLHDAWLLSGHCAHSFNCDRWQTGCGNCPDLTIYPSTQRDSTAYNWRRKREIFRQSALYIAAPSHWLMRRVEKSILSAGIIEARVIPNGVDLSTFCPGNRESIRQRLDIDEASLVILFSAYRARTNPWKDYATLRAAIVRVAERWQGKPLICLALGEEAPPEQIGGAHIKFVPLLRNEKDVARYLQAADLYVHPARVDTFPNAVIEALACGVPAIATAVGGIPEQIDSETGFLVPPQDAGAMANCIEILLSNDDLRKRMGATAAQVAKKRFDLRCQVDHYLEWYSSIIESHRAQKSLSSH